MVSQPIDFGWLIVCLDCFILKFGSSGVKIVSFLWSGLCPNYENSLLHNIQRLSMTNKSIRLIWVDWFIFHFIFWGRLPFFFGGCLPFYFLWSSSIFSQSSSIFFEVVILVFQNKNWGRLPFFNFFWGRLSSWVKIRLHTKKSLWCQNHLFLRFVVVK